jgi:Tfp pilus assembly protein PilO
MKMKALPSWITPVLLGVTLSVVAGLLYAPLMTRIGQRNAALRKLAMQIAEAEALMGGLEEQERALQQARTLYRHVEERAGQGPTLARILEHLSAQARDHQLELTSVQPQSEAGEARAFSVGASLTLRDVPVRLTLTGRYRHIGEFLEGLNQAPFFSSIHTLTMAKSGHDVAPLQIELLLSVYLAQPPATR